MLHNKNKIKAPEAMTWRKASPIIVLAVLFDLIRAFFDMFWFLGPALGAIYCTLKVSSFLETWTFGLLGTGTTAAICSAGSAFIGVSFSELTIPFGVIMASAIGFMAFLVLGLLIVIRNPRIFKANASGVLWFSFGGLGSSLIPFINALPVFSGVLWKLYKKQIDDEGLALKRWKTKYANDQRQHQERIQVEQSQERSLLAEDTENNNLYTQQSNTETE